MNISTPAHVPSDMGQSEQLRSMAERKDPGALREAARQFEGLFVQMMLKSMRDASSGDELFGSEQMGMYRDMYDQKIAQSMTAGKGIGIAEALLRQLQASEAASSQPAPAPPGSADPEAFVKQLWPHAQGAAARLGVSPETLVAQAALETGWGASVIHDPQGRSSNNLFNIKAHAATQPQLQHQTTEYREGRAVHESANFRRYESVAESFDDYARLIGGAERYADARAVAGDADAYLNALQAGGYATDPRYADKISQLMRGEHFQRAVQELKSDV